MPHPHDPLIRAYLDGKPVQFLDGNEWRDIEPADSIKKMPHFYRDGEYRLKPQVIRYRVYVTNGCVGVIQTLEQERKLPAHVRWLTEWQEVVL